MPSQPRPISRLNSCDFSRSMPRRRWPYGPARATAPGLDPEEVVEHSDHEVVVDVATLMPDHEGHDREAVEIGIAQDLEVGVAAPALDRSADEGFLPAADLDGADRLLELEDKSGADRLHDGRRSALLTMLDVGQVVVFGRIDIGNRPAARHARHFVAEELAPAGQ